MTVASAFRNLADVLEELEAAGFEIGETRSRDGEGCVDVELEVYLPALNGIDAGDGVRVALRDASATEDDRVALDLAITAPFDPAAGTAEASDGARADADRGTADRQERDRAERAESGDDGSGARGSREVVDADERSVEADGADGADADDEERPEVDGAERPAANEADGADANDADDANDPDDADDVDRAESGAAEAGPAETDDGNATPAHRDPEKLRAVYEEHDTFAEMTAALGVDVTPQTVRLQMIEHGIHEPASDRSKDEPSSGDGEREASEGSAMRADGIDLPDGAGLDEVKEAVRTSRTVHEVARSLGIDRERTRRLLAELDLLDLVTGRISAEREVTVEEVDRRVERAVPGNA